MKILDVNSVEVELAVSQAVEVLRSGGMIIYPTETAYGLGVDATNEQAVKKMLKYKGGRKNQPTSVAMADMNMSQKFTEINKTAKHLYDEFLPGPITVISKGKGKVAREIESRQGTLGVRIPDQELALAIISELNTPITATSANTSGKKTPYSLKDWGKYTSKSKASMVDLFLDAGTLKGTPPSTIVDTTMNSLDLIRQGGIVIEGGEGRFSNNPEETEAVGGEIVDKYVDKLNSYPLIVAIQGELGAGKTQMVKGMANKLQVIEPVTSPTYQIMKQYPYICGKVSGKLIHIDTWRLDNPEELEDWHVDNLLVAGNVIAIEWLEKIKEMITAWQKNAIVVWVTLEGAGDEERRIRYKVVGEMK